MCAREGLLAEACRASGEGSDAVSDEDGDTIERERER